jgi:hypothetical protein
MMHKTMMAGFIEQHLHPFLAALTCAYRLFILGRFPVLLVV